MRSADQYEQGYGEKDHGPAQICDDGRKKGKDQVKTEFDPDAPAAGNGSPAGNCRNKVGAPRVVEEQRRKKQFEAEGLGADVIGEPVDEDCRVIEGRDPEKASNQEFGAALWKWVGAPGGRSVRRHA